MSNVLDRVAAQLYSQVRPQTVREFFALQLARKLGDAPAVKHYIALVDERSEEGLLVAYHRAVAASGHRHEGLARNFHTALNRTNGSGPRPDASRLLSIKVERRSISAAVLFGRHIEDVETRHLSSSRSKGEASAVAFVRWFVSNFEIESAAMEYLPDGDVQRSVLDRMIAAMLADQEIPLLRVPKDSLIPAFAHPEPDSRRDVRETVRSIWPILDTDTGVLDAVALGLYVQTERMFVAAD